MLMRLSTLRIGLSLGFLLCIIFGHSQNTIHAEDSMRVADSMAAVKMIKSMMFHQISDSNLLIDEENVFTKQESKDLLSLVNKIRDSLKLDIAVVSIDSTFTNKENFDNAAMHIAGYWKMVNPRRIIICFSTGLRRIRINNSNAIERSFSDGDTKALIDTTIIPHFKKNEYFEGIRSGIIQLVAKVH